VRTRAFRIECGAVGRRPTARVVERLPQNLGYAAVRVVRTGTAIDLLLDGWRLRFTSAGDVESGAGGGMAELKIKNGKAYCAKCDEDVEVSELAGDPNRGEKPLVLVDKEDHVIGERYTRAGAWNRAA
jgi:hypothetical protein